MNRDSQGTTEAPIELEFIIRLFSSKKENERSWEDTNVFLTPVNILFSVVIAVSGYLYYRLD